MLKAQVKVEPIKIELDKVCKYEVFGVTKDDKLDEVKTLRRLFINKKDLKPLIKLLFNEFAKENI